MKYLLIFLIVAVLTGCSDHYNVMQEYKEGNPHATDLLLHGLNEKNSYYISTYLIKHALRGDETAKQIIYAQVESLRGLPSHPSTVAVPVVISGRR